MWPFKEKNIKNISEIIAKEFLSLLTKNDFVDRFRPNIVYKANIILDRKEFYKPIEFISINYLEIALMYSHVIDEYFDGKFKCGKSECVVRSIDDVYNVKLTNENEGANYDRCVFSIKFVNTLTDKQLKMKILSKNIQNAIEQLKKVEKLYEDLI